MRAAQRRISRIVAAMLLVLAIVCWLPVAQSAPGDGGQVAAAPNLSLAALGSEPTLLFYGDQGVISLTIPVPKGMAVDGLDAVVEMPVNVSAATVTAVQDERVLSRVDIPGSGGPISIPLRDAKIADNALTVTLHSYLTANQGYCLDPSNPLRLVAAHIRYLGQELPPRAVADFLPPVLTELILFLPRNPTRAESETTMRMAQAVVAHYGKQYPKVTVTALPDGRDTPPEPSGPLQRQIVVRESPNAGVMLEGEAGVPFLVVSGPADRLLDQARLLSSELGRLAVSSKAVVGPLRPSPLLPPKVTTLRDLGQAGLRATALAPQVSIGLDQTRFGRAVHGVRVQLRGSHTPLPPSVAGQMMVSVGGQVVDRWPADKSGSFDRWVDVPDDLLVRYTDLVVTVDISGNTGRCGEFQPITLTVNGDSQIESSAAKPPVPGGFQAVPQTLMPRMEIGFDGGFDDTRRAAAIVVALQRLSALPFDITATSVAEAISSPAPAILISANGWSDGRITLPVSVGSADHITVQHVDGTPADGTLTLDPAQKFATLQTKYDGDRMLLIATSNNAPDQLDDLLGWINADVSRWSRVSGGVLIGMADRDPVVVGTKDVRITDALVAQSRLHPWWVLDAVVVTLILVGGTVVVRRRRRRRRAP
ncbi:hypothetical protein [Mycolicibacterium aubagnense]|nr:hypothetical protein [Mycolicibacterium aubagnense]